MNLYRSLKTYLMTNLFSVIPNLEKWKTLSGLLVLRQAPILSLVSLAKKFILIYEKIDIRSTAGRKTLSNIL